MLPDYCPYAFNWQPSINEHVLIPQSANLVFCPGCKVLFVVHNGEFMQLAYFKDVEHAENDIRADLPEDQVDQADLNDAINDLRNDLEGQIDELAEKDDK